MAFLKHLFNPIRIGNMTAKNRLLMSAMSINFGVNDNGYVNEQLISYFKARAKGGVGMMLVGGGAIHPSGLELPNLPMLWDDGCIPALKKMVNAIKPYDTRFGVQLMHGGRQSYHDQKVAPSPIPAPAVVKGIPKELNIDEIHELIAAFGDSARRCRKAGFDFIEIHAAHGYLINQFMSRNSNFREDSFGGSFENRIKFLLELFRDIKQKAGQDFPVGIRMNGEDYIKNGWNIEDAVRLAPILEKEGADYLHISAGVYGSKQLTIPSMYVEHGCFVNLADRIKKEISIPVVTVGRIKNPEMADSIIREQRADIVSMGRSLLADPELPNKAASGAFSDIRPCMGCCLGCIHAVLALEPGGCVVNPDVGREYLLSDDEKTESSKTVLIAGSGPAGLAAARITAKRGHKVIICDEKGEIGGLMKLASIPPGRSEVMDIIRFFQIELEKLNVEIRLNTLLDEKLLLEIAPDAVVLATGSLPEMPIIKGIYKTDMDLCTVVEVLEKKAAVGDRVLILGGNQAGLLLADHLAEKGKEVAVLHRGQHFAEEMSSNDRFYLRERLKRDSVKLYKNIGIKSFSSEGVSFSVKGEQTNLNGFDSIVISDKMEPVREAGNLLKSRKIETHIIGDAKTPRNFMLAISEGEEIGREI